MRNVGDLQVWWIPQIPSENIRFELFTVDVESVKEGVKILNALADYDLYQLEYKIKPDFSNAGGLVRWCEDNGDGTPGWEDWYDEETDIDDPEEWLALNS